MLRTVSRAVAICDDCGTTASDEEANILVLFDAADAFKTVTKVGGPDGLGPWAVLPAVGLVCHDCHTKRVCAELGHDWYPERPCLCVDGRLRGGCPERSQVCSRCHTVHTTHQRNGGVR
ncbi:hypothetical protein [Saccharopolyspora shandongensis]|uniref:hypothetical protein n=1 Tax=Saccharopolyspora shandongensis TaxID=418495 RepID=UPI0033F2EC50